MGDHKSWLRSFGARREPPECSQYMLVATYPKGPVIPNERAEQAAAAALQELTGEKRKPHYDLASIKATFATVEALRMTKTAHDCALGLGLLLQDVVDLVQEMTREQFHKSMTSKANVAVWQDVYFVPWCGTVLYVKFTTDAPGLPRDLVQGEVKAMAKQIKTQPCTSCGGTMRFERHDDVLVYRDHKKRIKTLGWWCGDCEEAILDGKALAARERAFLELKADVDEVLGPQEVTQVREKLGLSQRAAGELLGGGPRAFQKYEAGKQAVSAPMSNLLRLLANDPARL